MTASDGSMKPGALTPERVAEGLSPDWTAEDRLLVVAALLPDLQDDIYAGRYSQPGRPNITSLQHILGDPAESLEEYRADFEPHVRAFQQLCATGMRGSPEAVATEPEPPAPLGSLTPARRLELAQVGHRAAMAMRDAMAAQDVALGIAIRGLAPQSDDAIEALAIVLASFVRVGMSDVEVARADDFVSMVVEKTAEAYAHAMPPDAIAKLCERTKAMVREPAIPLTKPADRPS
jgi:hypothetical protein